MSDNITQQRIYVVTSKTNNETYLIEAYTNEAAAIEHVRRAIDWFKDWCKNQNPFLPCDIWPNKANPWDNVTPEIIDNSIIYDWQNVTLNK